MGVAIFDKDHERLATQMSRINTALLEKHDRALALNLLESLIYETQAHFDHEEAVMRNLEFPEREAHVTEHTALIQQAKTMLQQIENGSTSMLALPKFLRTWLMDHIHITDRKYAAWMRRNGLH